MLKNAPTLAIGGADTAENEPPKVRQVSNKIRRNIGGDPAGRAGARSLSGLLRRLRVDARVLRRAPRLRRA